MSMIVRGVGQADFIQNKPHSTGVHKGNTYVFHQSHEVAMSVSLCVCLRHWVLFFSRPVIGPEVT